MESNDDDKDEHFESDDGIVEFDGLRSMEQSDIPMGAIVRFSDNKFINPNGKGFGIIGHYNVKDHK